MGNSGDLEVRGNNGLPSLCADRAYKVCDLILSDSWVVCELRSDREVVLPSRSPLFLQGERAS